MATAELGEWHIAKCNILKEASELVLFAEGGEDSPPVQISIVGLDAILALRDLIDEEVARAEQRAELASNEGGGLTA